MGAIGGTRGPVTRWLSIAPAPTSLLIGALVWEVLGRVGGYRFLPPFSAVVARAVELAVDGPLVDALASSLLNLAIGLTIAIVLGITVGLAMGVFDGVGSALRVFVYAGVTTPSIVFAPIFFSIFGIGPEPVIAVIVMFAVFKIIINTEAGVRNVSPSLIEMARSFSAGRMVLFTRIMLPAAAPMILAAIRVGAASAVQGMVNGEMFIAVVGLGAMVMSSGRRFDSEGVLAILVVLLILAFALVRGISWVDGRLTSWLPSTTRTEGTVA